MNYFVLHKNNQNIQMHSHNLMFNQILASVGVDIPLHIPDVPDIVSLKNISTNL